MSFTTITALMDRQPALRGRSGLITSVTRHLRAAAAFAGALCIAASGAAQSRQVPAPAQNHPIVIHSATVHTVSGETIDLMVALSFPDRFVVDRGALAAAFRTPDPVLDNADLLTRDAYSDAAWGYGGLSGYPGFWSTWRIGRSGYGYPYGYGYRLGYPGYGDPYYWPYSRRWIDPGLGGPIIVVERKADAGGRAVAGGGYTRGNQAESRGKAVPRAGASRAGAGRSSAVAPASSSSGAKSGGGYKAGDKTSSGDSGGRKAKPRTGGSQ